MLEKALATGIKEGQGAQGIGLLSGDSHVGVATLRARAAEAVALGARFCLRVGLRVRHAEPHLTAGGIGVGLKQALYASGIGLQVGREAGVRAANKELEGHWLTHAGGEILRSLGESKDTVLGEVGLQAETPGDDVGEEAGGEDSHSGEEEGGAVHGIQRRSMARVPRPRPAKATLTK